MCAGNTKGYVTMNTSIIEMNAGFSLSPSVEKAISSLTSGQAQEAARALASTVDKNAKKYGTAARTAAEAVENFNRAAAINLSIISETSKFGKNEAYSGIGDFAETAFNMKKARTSQLVNIGKTFYREKDETAAKLCDMFSSTHLVALLPLRTKGKSGKVTFPFDLCAKAIEAGELRGDMTVTEVKDWVDEHTESEPEVEKLCNWYIPNAQQSFNKMTESQFLVNFEGYKLRPVKLNEGEAVHTPDDDKTACKVMWALSPDYTNAFTVWVKPYKAESAAPVKMSMKDRLKALLAQMTDEEIAEVLDAGEEEANEE